MSETPRQSIGSANASPTKEFFVRMLTRDIELQDAILDLLDNCVDGILRSGNAAQNSERPYEGFKATITFASDHFIIEDNCGGIPIETAKKYAFAMGRPSYDTEQHTQATVGMYGIGMKRAIFKIGTEALVESRNDEGFVVEFSPDWMSSNLWDNLPMYPLPDEKLAGGGTTIEIYQLNAEVSGAFSDTTWIDEFRKIVSRHYTIIISKGFQIVIGTAEQIKAGATPVAPESFRLIETAAGEGKDRIAPFVYVGEIGDVKVEIFAGLYRELPSEEELEAEENTKGATDDAGWTVACNDRVVIWKDRSRLTGWGEATVPSYHGQFIPITGIVLLSSTDPRKLPLTTTKRGIDAASDVYSEVKDLMRDATKKLVSFTNKWKKFPEKRETLYRSSSYLDLKTLRSLPESIELTESRKSPQMRKFEPNYPEPEQERTSARISFVASFTDIDTLAEHFFETKNVKPKDVGEAAFNDALKTAKGA